MRKRTRFVLLAVVLLVILVAAVAAVYHASQQVPAFYAKAIAIPPQSQQEDSEQMLKQATALYSDLQDKGQWQEVFKAQTINGWLAVDLPQNHPTLVSGGIHDPRVEIGPQRITLACQVDHSGFHGVVSLEVSAFRESDDVVGLRVHNARLGAVPWSIRPVLDTITEAAKKSDVDLSWRQTDSDPVALIKITSAKGNRKQIVHIDTIRLEEGQLVVAGTTELAK